MKKLILLIFLLTSCASPIVEIQTISTYQTFLPLVSNISPKFKIGVGNENSSGKDLEEYYQGDFLAVYVHAERFRLDGVGYIDRRDIPGSYIFLQLKGVFAEWVDPLPTCSPVPEKYWDAWITEFAIPVIEHIGPKRVVYLDLMNETEAGDFAPEYLGCWGSDYQSGAYYARFANYAAAKLREIYPYIQYSAGAFIDPTSPMGTVYVDGFLSEIENIDVISLHLHQNYSYEPKIYKLLEHMEARTDLPLAMSETSVVCDTWSLECDQKQVEHFQTLNDLTNSGRIRYFIWYTLGLRANCWSWRNSDMIFCNPVYARPVYYEYERVQK